MGESFFPRFVASDAAAIAWTREFSPCSVGPQLVIADLDGVSRHESRWASSIVHSPTLTAFYRRSAPGTVPDAVVDVATGETTTLEDARAALAAAGGFHTAAVEAVSDNGRFVVFDVATAASPERQRLWLWDIETDVLHRSDVAFQGGVHRPLVADDGRVLYRRPNHPTLIESTVVEWNPSTGVHRTLFSGPLVAPDGIGSFVATPDLRTVASSIYRALPSLSTELLAFRCR